MSVNGTVTFFSLQSLPFFFSPLSILIKWQDKSHFSVKQSESYSFRHKLCDSAQMRRAGDRRISSVAGCHLMDAERTVSLGWLCLLVVQPPNFRVRDSGVLRQELQAALDDSRWHGFSSLFIFVSQTDDTAGFQKFPMAKKKNGSDRTRRKLQNYVTPLCEWKLWDREKLSHMSHWGDLITPVNGLMEGGWENHCWPTKNSPHLKHSHRNGGKWKRTRLYC